MMLQLRTYTLKPGTLAAWTAVFRDRIRPLRESLGFTVPAAWAEPAENRFVWLLAYDGPEEWATLDAAYHASPVRRAISPDPAAMIVRMETCFVEPVA